MITKMFENNNKIEQLVTWSLIILSEQNIIAGDVFKAVSHEATKLSLAYSKPPVPSNEECESLLASVEKTVLALLHVYSNLPKSAGI